LEVQESVYDSRVEMPSPLLLYFLERLLPGPGSLVRAVVNERVEDISNRYNPPHDPKAVSNVECKM